jgi:RNA polymerase sigma-70 factor (ECF subfamily)
LKLSDADLVKSTLQGNKEAFGQLYDRYARLIRAICNDSTHNFSESQDLAQEVFLRAYTKLEWLENPQRFGPWLVSIARNIGREYRRGKFRDRHIFTGSESPEEKAGQKSEDSGNQLSDELHGALEKLNERERLALHVYYLQDEDIEKARQILDMSRSSFYRLLAKARKKLEKIIEKTRQG